MSITKAEDVIDIRMSKHRNEGKIFTGNVLIALEKLTIGERASMLNYALTKEQQIEYDEHIAIVDKAMATEGTAYNFVKKMSERTAYQPDIKVLVLNGVPIDVSKSFEVHGLLTVLFSERSFLTTPIPYEDFIDENKTLLKQWDLADPAKLRSAKSNCKKILHRDIFPQRGTFVLDEKYTKGLVTL